SLSAYIDHISQKTAADPASFDLAAADKAATILVRLMSIQKTLVIAQSIKQSTAQRAELHTQRTDLHNLRLESLALDAAESAIAASASAARDSRGTSAPGTKEWCGTAALGCGLDSNPDLDRARDRDRNRLSLTSSPHYFSIPTSFNPSTSSTQ